MKLRDYVYIICMIFFAVLSYLLIERGFNIKTKNIVNYQEKSDVLYRVYLKDNDEFSKEYLNMNERYISSLVDKINIDFNYNSIFSKNISGYYNYSAVGTLYAYLDDINDPVWKNEYKLLDFKTVVLNKNNVNTIDINDTVVAYYDKYKEDLASFSKKYGLDLSGYLEITFNIKDNLQFNGIDKIITDDKTMTLRIPLTYDTFKISVTNDNNNIDSYYDFSTKEEINYILLVIGAIALAISISFMALIIRNIVLNSNDKNRYANELHKILTNNEDKIIKVKQFYNKKKYNLIYVDSFQELLEVYDKVRSPISYREIKKDRTAMFIIIDEDNAWIYILNNDSVKNK